MPKQTKKSKDSDAIRKERQRKFYHNQRVSAEERGDQGMVDKIYGKLGRKSHSVDADLINKVAETVILALVQGRGGAGRGAMGGGSAEMPPGALAQRMGAPPQAMSGGMPPRALPGAPPQAALPPGGASGMSRPMPPTAGVNRLEQMLGGKPPGKPSATFRPDKPAKAPRTKTSQLTQRTVQRDTPSKKNPGWPKSIDKITAKNPAKAASKPAPKTTKGSSKPTPSQTAAKAKTAGPKRQTKAPSKGEAMDRKAAANMKKAARKKEN